MYNNRIGLTPQDIFDKEFKIDTRGYRLQEVDKYLDQIIKDYVEFINIIKELKSENKELVQESQQKITQLTHKYKQLSDISKLPTKMERMRVPKYRRISVKKLQ